MIRDLFLLEFKFVLVCIFAVKNNFRIAFEAASGVLRNSVKCENRVSNVKHKTLRRLYFCIWPAYFSKRVI